ncbi:MAG: peptidylprolyl isomerase [Gammaproteobacteria bacterium]|nr:peptidylprolyl isomerase [Gammaproteobacteria bacterium]
MSGLIARQGDLAVGPGTRVTPHFSIHLATGEEIDTTRRGKPAVFAVGDGKLPEGSERALVGLRPGDDERIPIAPADGFGLRKKANIRTLPKDNFPNASDLVPGMMIAFAATGSESGELPGVVTSASSDTVMVDFNHPLAGRDLVFHVTILKVEAV